MPLAKVLPRAAIGAAVATVLLALASAAGAAPAKPSPLDRSPFATDTGDVFTGGAHQHGSDEGHLPGSSANVALIGELEPTDEFGPIVPGQIADLSVYKDFAYLNSWNEESCTRGGTYVADIRNPRRPKEVAFIPALSENYHGEGAHVVSASTRSFAGDLLAVNNEICTGRDPSRGG